MRRVIFPAVLGLGGCAILIALGVWQMQRLAWKTAILTRIEATIAAAPVPLPESPDPQRDEYLPVTVTGALGGVEARVLTSVRDRGPGVRVLSVLTSGDRQILVDLGFVPQDATNAPRMAERVTVTGNLLWPDEVDGWTPPHDPAADLWFARDLPAIAAALGTEPVLVVARDLSGATLAVSPLPVTTEGIPNNHREYAITWFSLAVVWAAMSGFLMWRVARRRD